jgi:murein DD-endopeptidase MepM/ murein hydrolase activator NlpD
MNFRLYYYSKESLRFVEARWAKLKIFATTLVVFFLTIGIVSFFDNSILPPFLRGQSAIERENYNLRRQLLELSEKAKLFQQRLDELNLRGNEIRLKVDLPKVDEDSRQVGTGGTFTLPELHKSSDLSNLVSGIDQTIVRLEREFKFQETNYSEIMERYNENTVRFNFIPALKPMEGSYSPDGFGWRKHPVLHIYRMHEGLDINNDIGTPIYAPANGVVKTAGRWEAGYGLMMIIDHGYGFTTLYGHLKKPIVREGQQVNRGDLIAFSGNTGLTSGPHLHYEIWQNGVRKNPMDFFFDDINRTDYLNAITSE